MRAIHRDEILDRVTYRDGRSRLREKSIESRRVRIVQLGDRVSLAFESRDSILYRLHEALWSEAVAGEPEIQRILEIQNDQMPGRGDLVGGLFLEVGDPERIRQDLEDLAGLGRQGSLWLDFFEEGPCGAHVEGEDAPQSLSPLALAVRFALPQAAIARFLDPARSVDLVLDHPRCPARSPIQGATREALCADLAGSGP